MKKLKTFLGVFALSVVLGINNPVLAQNPEKPF